MSRQYLVTASLVAIALGALAGCSTSPDSTNASSPEGSTAEQLFSQAPTVSSNATSEGSDGLQPEPSLKGTGLPVPFKAGEPTIIDPTEGLLGRTYKNTTGMANNEAQEVLIEKATDFYNDQDFAGMAFAEDYSYFDMYVVHPDAPAVKELKQFLAQNPSARIRLVPRKVSMETMQQVAAALKEKHPQIMEAAPDMIIEGLDLTIDPKLEEVLKEHENDDKQPYSELTGTPENNRPLPTQEEIKPICEQAAKFVAEKGLSVTCRPGLATMEPPRPLAGL
ncbi:hypothetical protein BK816_00745 [Boudabousia tangfeifanii]|uniref:Uncharacterized protein n=1 Tax=Boudabousia tangfeifanii TaxID=1912795 RepID=A0A1D9MIG9_9ACTO|nr:hypothetical protein [Boudabousia tangfeifanii]AOZ72003.1 hypothetical protein BK816_00745 [Boudabousia tangfeifanii]